MANVDFTKLMARKVEDAKKPKPLPAGTYLCIIENYIFGTSSKKGTPYIRFNFKPMMADEDVDAEELAALAQELEMSPQEWMAKKGLRMDFYLTDDAMYRLRDFLEAGLGLDTSGTTFDKVVPDTKNMSIKIAVTREIGDDGESMYAVPTGYAKAD